MPQETSVKAPLTEAQAGDRIAALKAPAQKADKADKAAPKNGKQPPEQAKVAKQKPKKQPQTEAEADGDDAADNIDLLAAQADDEREADTAEDDAATDDEGEDDHSSDDEQDPDADGADDDQEGSDDDESEQTFDIKLDGETHQVSLEELVAGYQRQADYTKKTKVLAQQRRELEAAQAEAKDLPEIRKATAIQGQQFQRDAALVITALQQKFMPAKPDAALAASNPAEYLRQKEAFEEAGQFVQAMKNTASKYHADAEAQVAADQKKAIQAGRAKLMEVLPEMKDENTRRKLVSYVKGLGYTDENIASEPDHRLFVMADKARRYDEIMKRKAELKPGQNRPKVMKQTKAAEGHKAIADKKAAAVINNHRKTGSINSAAAAIEARLRK